MKKNYLYAALAASCVLVACDPSRNNPETGPDSDPDPTPSYDMLFTEIKVSPVEKETMEFSGECCSPNHKFMGGINEWTYNMAIWNVETNEVNEILGDFAQGALHGITNEGVAVGSCHKWLTDKPDWWDDEWFGEFTGMSSDGSYPIIIKNGVVEYLQMPANCIGGEAYCISDDGKTIAGFCFDESWATIACIWNEDGSFTQLEVPQNYGAKLDPFTEVRHMSSDASVLLGFVQDALRGDWIVCVWKKNGGSYELALSALDLGWGPVAEDGEGNPVFDEETWSPVYTGKYATADGEKCAAVSANGKYAAVIVTTPDDANWQHETYVLTVDLATKSISTSENLTPAGDGEQTDFSLIAVADNGTVLGYKVKGGGFGPMPLALGEGGREAFVIEAGKSEVKSLADVPGADKLGDFASVTPVWMAPNCSALAGFASTDAAETVSFVIY